jgi:hypothetical protein
MKISKAEVWGQIYLLPYIKITHTRDLNGDLELDSRMVKMGTGV